MGDNANPAAISDEVTLDPAAFDAAVSDRLVAFFGRALARDAGRRFDTAEEMADAWRVIFKEIPQSVPEPPVVGPLPATLTPDSPLEATGLTARARSALERLGVHTLGELLEYEPSALTRAKGVPDATRKEILAQVRVLRAQLRPVDAADLPELPLAHGVEAVCATLLPGPTNRNAKERELTADAMERLCLPEPSEKALTGLKFSAALPKRLAMATLAARLADLDSAAAVLKEPPRFVSAW